MFELTVFKNVYDNKTHRYMSFEDWNKFSSFIKSLSEKKYSSKTDACLISPAVYQHNKSRSNKHVLHWGKWAALDVDDIEIDGDKLYDELYSRFGRWSCVCYSTASSTHSTPKLRVVFELAERVEADQIRQLWWALNSESKSVGDKQTKDLSRMYYVPGNYNNAFNFYYNFTSDNVIDPNALIKKFPMPEKKTNNLFDRLPEDMQKAILEHRKSSLNNTSYKWNSYADCPFLSKRMLSKFKETTISKDSGRYHTMYSLMVNIASNAIRSGYPITPNEIAYMCRQLDLDTGNRYESRPFEVEAERAISYSFSNNL